jgi:hypothetical protein
VDKRLRPVARAISAAGLECSAEKLVAVFFATATDELLRSSECTAGELPANVESAANRLDAACKELASDYLTERVA